MEVADFMTQLDDTCAVGLYDMNYDDEEEVPEVEEVDDPVGTNESQKSNKRCWSQNYCVDDEVALCQAWLKV